MTRLLLTLGMIATLACGGAPSGGLDIGGSAPSFEARAIDGGTVALEDLAGEPRILVFWATWCGPCLEEIPALEAIESDHPGRVISIALDESGKASVAPFLAERPLSYKVLLGDADLFALFDGLGIPHTVVLDRDLRVVAVHRGIIGADVLRRDLASL